MKSVFNFEKENFEVSYEVEQVGLEEGFCDYEQFIELEGIVKALREIKSLCNIPYGFDVLATSLIMFQTGVGYEIEGVYQKDKSKIVVTILDIETPTTVESLYHMMALSVNMDIKTNIRSEETKRKFEEFLNIPEDIFLSTLEEFYSPHTTIRIMKSILKAASTDLIEEFLEFCCEKLFISLEGENILDSLITIYEFMVTRYSNCILADWRE